MTMFEKLIELGLTDKKRIDKVDSLELMTFDKVGKTAFASKIKSEKGRTHTAGIDFDMGAYFCDCEDFGINKRICSHELLNLVQVGKLNSKLVDYFLDAIDSKNFGVFLPFSKELPKDYLPTGCRALDEILGGGIPHQSPILIFSNYNVGKSIACHQLAANCWKLRKKRALYIDTENSFVRETDRERIQNWFRLRWDIPDFRVDYKYLSNIETLFSYFGWTIRLRYGEKGKMDSIIVPLLNKEGFKIDKKEIAVYKDFYKNNYGLIVLDSITQPVEGLIGSGQEQFPGRKPILANLIAEVRKISVEFDIPAVITAHLSKGPTAMSSPTFKGGSALGYGSKYIVYLKGGEKIGPRAFKRDRAVGLEPGIELSCELKKDFGFS